MKKENHGNKIKTGFYVVRLFLCCRDEKEGYKELFEGIDQAREVALQSGKSNKSVVLAVNVARLRTHVINTHALDHTQFYSSKEELSEAIGEAIENINDPLIQNKRNIHQNTDNLIGRIKLLIKYIEVLSQFPNQESVVHGFKYDLIKAIFSTKEKIDYGYLCYTLSSPLVNLFNYVCDKYRTASTKIPDDMTDFGAKFNAFVIEYLGRSHDKPLSFPALVDLGVPTVHKKKKKLTLSRKTPAVISNAIDYSESELVCILDIRNLFVDLALLKAIVNKRIPVLLLTGPLHMPFAKENYEKVQRLLVQLGYPAHETINFNDQNDISEALKNIQAQNNYKQAIVVSTNPEKLSSALVCDLKLNICVAVKPNSSSKELEVVNDLKHDVEQQIMFINEAIPVLFRRQIKSKKEELEHKFSVFKELRSLFEPSKPKMSTMLYTLSKTYPLLTSKNLFTRYKENEDQIKNSVIELLNREIQSLKVELEKSQQNAQNVQSFHAVTTAPTNSAPLVSIKTATFDKN